MAKNLELEAIYVRERIRFDNSDTIIGEIRLPNGTRPPEINGYQGPLAVKGIADIDALETHLSYRFYGHWTEYHNKRTDKKEKQFQFKTFIRATPYDRAGVITYLIKAGKDNNIGRARATKLWDKFKSDAVRILREEPEIAADVLNIADTDCERASEWLMDQYHLEAVSIDMIDLLDRRGFPKALAKQTIKAWGNRAPEIVKRDPFKLMAFRGCGFKRCDKMYVDLGLPLDRLKRQALCAWYSIASDSEGHTWYPIEKAVMAINSISGKVDPFKAMRLAKRARALDVKKMDDRYWIAEYQKSKHEEYIADHVTAAASESPRWCLPDDLESTQLTNHQKTEISKLLKQPIGIFGGSPGTGKTFTAGALIRLLLKNHSPLDVAVCAPTGKAAVRITEAMKALGIEITARTIHSLLSVESSDDGWSFGYGEYNPLPHKFIIVDESSMIDTDLMCALLKARNKGTSILLVGDINQLAPVGHGAPLRDLIRAGMPYAELTEIQRNSGDIVKACANIRDGKPFAFSPKIDFEKGWNLYLAEAANEQQQIAKMLQVFGIAKSTDHCPIWDCQVLVPVNRKSKLARRALNKILQSELNKNPKIDACSFRLADKVVNTKNGWFEFDEAAIDDPNIQMNEDGKVYVANGELGEVISIEGRLMEVKLNSPSRVVKVPLGKSDITDGDQQTDNATDDESTGTGCNWDLGYALSVHKFQGSEVPISIEILDEYPGARMVCSREWLYTGISRAKKLCVAIGKKETAYAMLKRKALDKRKTFLRELILEKSGGT